MRRIELIWAGIMVLAALTASAGRTVVGVVNWDCLLPSDTWFGHYATTSLSPAAFRHATPYYADVKGPDRIDYHRRTVEEYDRELRFAIDAGIDYFAYCWYGERPMTNGNPVATGITTTCDEHVWELAAARKLHLESPLRERIRLCAILVTVHHHTDEDLAALVRTMKEPCYQRACGRPLVYLYAGTGAKDRLLPRLRAECVRQRVEEPYCALMGNGKHATSGEDGVDALSSYTDGIGFISRFKELNDHALDANTRRVRTGLPVIPTFTVGWDPRPRLAHPVPWWTYPDAPYMSPATADELVAGGQAFADWMKANRAACPTGHVLAFAWNEFEEGGWICPTWTANGPDTSRLKAFRRVADLWRTALDGGEN